MVSTNRGEREREREREREKLKPKLHWTVKSQLNRISFERVAQKQTITSCVYCLDSNASNGQKLQHSFHLIIKINCLLFKLCCLYWHFVDSVSPLKRRDLFFLKLVLLFSPYPIVYESILILLFLFQSFVRYSLSGNG